MFSFRRLFPEEQIATIAKDNRRKPDYYPIECTEVGDKTIRSLDQETVLLLLEKLKHRRKGPWKDFCEKLKRIHR